MIEPIDIPPHASPRHHAIAAFLNASLLFELRRRDLEAKLDELVVARLDLERAAALVEEAHTAILGASREERVDQLEQRRQDVLEGLSDGERQWLEAVA